MKYFGIEVPIKNVPELDAGFVPLQKFYDAFLQDIRGTREAPEPFALAVGDGLGRVIRADAFIHGDDVYFDADRYYIERRIKTLLWTVGGCEIYLSGREAVCRYIADAYSAGGARGFDAAFMGSLYSRPFRVVIVTDFGDMPVSRDRAVPLGRNFDGCRIGFDAGGSDRKVSAVIDGESVYSRETVWHPKTESDPSYHYNGIVNAFKEAAAQMPRVDAIGISSAGIYAGNRTLYAQLFGKVPRDLFDAHIRDIYINAAREIGWDIPIEVANDGDVTALAGSISLNRNNILGIAMGTSEAVGFVDDGGNITGWLNELAFAPVDGSQDAAEDDWSGDIGCGYKYFSQEAVIRLAPAAGIALGDDLTPGEKLKRVQGLLEGGSVAGNDAGNDVGFDGGREGAAAIFRTIGCYLAHTAALYHAEYGMGAILLLGRVMSGRGGEIIVATAEAVLKDEYPDLDVDLCLPNEEMRRLGQSVVAASLPRV
jgi:hypothetical protein